MDYARPSVATSVIRSSDRLHRLSTRCQSDSCPERIIQQFLYEFPSRSSVVSIFFVISCHIGNANTLLADHGHFTSKGSVDIKVEFTHICLFLSSRVGTRNCHFEVVSARLDSPFARGFLPLRSPSVSPN
jgi:hypothetical protein